MVIQKIALRLDETDKQIMSRDLETHTPSEEYAKKMNAIEEKLTNLTQLVAELATQKFAKPQTNRSRTPVNRSSDGDDVPGNVPVTKYELDEMPTLEWVDQYPRLAEFTLVADRAFGNIIYYYYRQLRHPALQEQMLRTPFVSLRPNLRELAEAIRRNPPPTGPRILSLCPADIFDRPLSFGEKDQLRGAIREIVKLLTQDGQVVVVLAPIVQPAVKVDADDVWEQYKWYSSVLEDATRHYIGVVYSESLKTDLLEKENLHSGTIKYTRKGREQSYEGTFITTGNEGGTYEYKEELSLKYSARSFSTRDTWHTLSRTL